MTLRESGQVPRTVFHYTSLAGLVGIIENEELWLSDIEFLNDSEELRYAARLLHTAIMNRIERDYGDQQPPGDDPTHRNLYATLFALEARFGIGVSRHSDSDSQQASATWDNLPFVVSFCRNGDLLSMWRGYADTGGFAIEFETARLLGAFNRGDFGNSDSLTPLQLQNGFFAAELVPVIYGEAELQAELDDILGDITSLSANHPGVVAYYSVENLVSTFARIKHPAFFEEQEIRLIVSPTGDMTPTPSLRSGPHHLVPFEKICLPPDAIESITVGPSPYQDRNSKALGRRFEYLSRGTRIQIRKSRVPLV